MCGIFGVVLRKPISMAKVFAVLTKLEAHQYPQEPRPVGGYGAGVAIVDVNGIVAVEKVGRVSDSPARHLRSLVKKESACVLVGHVRMPSPQFMEEARFKETAQPYLSQCFDDPVVVSVHNGYVANYEDVRLRLGKGHVFESETVGLIDSEVIPHWFEELLKKKHDPRDAVETLHSSMNGSNTMAVLQIGNGRKLLHVVHKGKTRGLFLWTNYHGEIVFCSRKEPVIEEMANVLASLELGETISIPYHRNGDLRVSYDLRKVVSC